MLMGITLGGCWKESRPLSSQAITALQALALTFNVESAFLAHGGFTLWDILLTFLFTLTQTCTIEIAAVDSYGFRPCPVSIRETRGFAEEVFKKDVWVFFWVLTQRKKELHWAAWFSWASPAVSVLLPSSSGGEEHRVCPECITTPSHWSHLASVLGPLWQEAHGGGAVYSEKGAELVRGLIST